MAVVESTLGVNVLIVSDGPARLEATYSGLDKLGWRPWRLAPADLTHSDISARPPDAVLLALTEGSSQTSSAIQTLQSEAPGIPVIVLTDDLGAAEQALFGGAIAVLPAMARTSLVHAQLRAVLRQTAQRHGHEPAGIVRVRGLKLDTQRHQVMANNRPLDLTPTEYRVLSVLVKHAGRALGADFLLRQTSALGPGSPPARETVKVHIARLRRKLEEATGEDDYIINVRNVGYLLERRKRGVRKA